MVIGLIVPDLSDTFFAACAHTIQHLARAHGYMTLVVASERDAELEVQQAELMASRQVAGLLVVTSTSRGDKRLEQLQANGLVIVAFDRPLDGIDSDCVLIENRLGAEEAVQHLLDHGHKRIACLCYDEETYTVRERILGYKSRMLAAGHKSNVVTGLATLDGVRDWLTNALKAKDRPTAIFALNHRTSTFLIQALNEQRVKIPAEMALIGFDDFELANVLSPPLTTVAQSPVELATRATALLMERIKGQQNSAQDDPAFTPAKILLPTRLQIRSSCGPHPATAAKKKR